MAASKRKVSPCWSYKPGQEPVIFEPKPREPKFRPQALAALETAKDGEEVERLLARIRDYRPTGKGTNAAAKAAKDLPQRSLEKDMEERGLL